MKKKIIKFKDGATIEFVGKEPEQDFECMGQLDDNHQDCWGYGGVFVKSTDLDELIFKAEGFDVFPLWERTVGRIN